MEEDYEEDYEVIPLPDNPIMPRSKVTKKTRKAMTNVCLFAGISQTIYKNHGFQINKSNLALSKGGI